MEDKNKQKASVSGDRSGARQHGHRRIADWRSNILSRLIIGIAAVVIILGLIIPDRDFSDNENRDLTTFPRPTRESLLSGDFTSDLSSYLADQFAFRDFWVSFNHDMEIISGKKETGDVYFGKKGCLLARPATPDDDAMSKTLDAMLRYHEAYPNIGMTAMIVPCYAAVDPSLLPAHAPVRDQTGDIASENQKLSDGGYQIVQAQSALEAHADEYIYYKTDHHWTTQGAYYAFTASQGVLDIMAPTATYTQYQVSDSFQGTLASQSGSYSTKDDIFVYALDADQTKYYVDIPDLGQTTTSVYDSSKLDEKDQYQVFFGGNHPLVEIHTANKTGRNLLVFKDSYANSLVPFYIPYFDNIYMIDPRYYYDSADILMTTDAITDVLFVYSQNTLAADTSLADVLNDASQSAQAASDASSDASAGTSDETSSGSEAVTATSANAAEEVNTESVAP
ncbi:MAG: DHHW family protein [Lachnospiraceae bacterium]|nr:DHHW family protein [Lachnospiraceae bacterium]